MKSIFYQKFADQFPAYTHRGVYLLEYRYVQGWITTKRWKPSRLVPRKHPEKL